MIYDDGDDDKKKEKLETEYGNHHTFRLQVETINIYNFCATSYFWLILWRRLEAGLFRKLMYRILVQFYSYMNVNAI